MAYKNIVFVKLEKRLLNDHRWYMMSDHAQLIYIKLILLAAETYNKIPKNDISKGQFDSVLHEAVRSKLEPGQFMGAIAEIKKNFPKFKSNKHFYYFDEFNTKTNYIPKQQSPSKSPAIAQHSVEEEKEEEKEKKKRKKFPLTDFEFLETLKNDPTYKHINIDFELGKMDAWLLANPGRQKTRRFIVKWLNRIDKPLVTQKKPEPKPDPKCEICQGKGKILEGTQKGAECICVK